MNLEKMTITPQSPSNLQPITVLFNPTTYSVSKSITWKPPAPPAKSDGKADADSMRSYNAPLLTFGGGGSRTLSLELFYDITEPDDPTIDDVRDLTDQVVALTRIERLKDNPQPPVCLVDWGDSSNSLDFPFCGVVSKLDQRFTLFRGDGKPVRATLTLAFTEFLDATKDKLETDPEFTTRVVRRGDTLSSIAAQAYGDPTAWRVVADANDLDDPRKLVIGSVLNLPKQS